MVAAAVLVAEATIGLPHPAASAGPLPASSTTTAGTSATANGSPAAAAAQDIIAKRKPGDEVPELRSANSTTHVTDEGTYRTTVSQEPVNYWTGSGWEPIDSSLRDTPGGVTAGANSFAATIADDVTAGDLAHVGIDGTTSVGWSFAGAATTARARKGGANGGLTPAAPTHHQRVGADGVAFRQALPGVSIEIHSQATGLKETLVLDSKASPDRFVFPLHLQGLTATLAPSGDVLLRAGDVVKAVIPAGWMEDSTPDPARRRAPAGAVSYSLIDQDGGVALAVTLDRGWLDDPGRTFPVRVDPTVHLQASGAHTPFDDTFVVAGFNNDHQTDATFQAGVNIFQSRGFVQFDLSSLKPGQTKVLDAELNLSLESSQATCASAPPMQLFPVTGSWQNSGTTPAFTLWPGPPVGPAITGTTQICPPAAGATTDPNVRTGYHLTSNGNASGSLAAAVRGWVDTPATNLGLGLRAQNEAAAAEFKKFTSTTGWHNSTVGGYSYNYWPPTLDILWEYIPTNLKVDGDIGGSGGSPVTYTSFANGEDCYPEYQPGNYYRPPPVGWGTPPQPQCRVDLYWRDRLPTEDRYPGDNPPVIVLIHGGGWMASADSNGYGRRRNTDVARYADAFAAQGYVVAVIDYRQGLFDFLRNTPGWSSSSWAGLQKFSLVYHCTQRFETDGSTPATWPPAAPLAPAAGAPPLPAECATLNEDTNGNGTSDYLDVLSLGDQARRSSVADVQAAVAWIRNGAGNRLTASASKVFLVGQSAGAIAAIGANYDTASTGTAAINGTVAMGAGFFADSLPITAAINQSGGRQILPPAGAGPLQVQMWEYDSTTRLDQIVAPVIPDERFTAGSFDFARQTAAVLRDNGYAVELRARIGFGHVPTTFDAQQFNNGMGEALTFLDNLKAGGSPSTGLWFGGANGTFQKKVGQDLMEDQAAAYRPKVGDFDGNGSSDILWWSPGGLGQAIWFSQGDGTFSRADLSYPVANDASYVRALGMFDASGNYITTGQPEQAQADSVVVADFNGDGKADILWYGKDAGDTSAVWYGAGDPYSRDVATTALFTRRVITVGSGFTNIVTGDFDGDGNQDAYLFKANGDDQLLSGLSAAPGTDASPVTFASTTITGNDGAYTPIAGNFDGDVNAAGRGRDDVLLVPPSGSGSTTVVLSGTDSRGVFSVATGPTPPTYATFVTGQFNGTSDGAARTDVFFHDPSWTTSTTWYGTAAPGSFTSVLLTNAPAGPYEINVGDFDGDGYSDLYFRGMASTANPDPWEALYRGRPGTGFTSVAQFQQVASDRTGIVGDFGRPANDATRRDDILWHVATSRARSGWRWQ